jgi:protein involved in polysaccharide export with SLBB domain
MKTKKHPKKGDMMAARTLSVIVVGLASILFGCSYSNTTTPAVETTPEKNQQLVQPYAIQPGDTLDIKFFFNPELNENVTVRPDGFISLQLVDEVLVAGLQPHQVDDILTEKYSRELKKPAITVIVKSFSGQRVFVGGEVGQQGLLAMPAGLTALQAVMQSGGFKITAQPSETLVIRKGPDNRPIPMRVDLSSALNGKTNSPDLILRPDDIIYVPKSPIAKANQFVNQYIEQLFLFRGVSLGFSYQLNNDNNN